MFNFQNCKGLSSYKTLPETNTLPINPGPVSQVTQVLKFSPGHEITPRIRTSNVALTQLDLRSSTSGGVTFLSSLATAFCGSSAVLCTQFYDDFKFLLTPLENGPCTSSADANIVVYTYTKPFERNSKLFSDWLAANTAKLDFLSPKQRAVNPRTDDLECPYGNPNVDKASTNGLKYDFQSQQLTFEIDNRVNPYRWIAPINTTFAREQPSTAFISYAKDPETRALTVQALTDSLAGTPSQQIYLDFEVELTVEDYRQAMAENTIYDTFPFVVDPAIDSLTPEQILAYEPLATDLFSRVWLNTILPNSLYRSFFWKYFKARMAQPSVQLSLPINFREDGAKWVSFEVLLAKLNYANAASQKPENTKAATYVFEGGTNPNASWYRFHADGFRDPEVVGADHVSDILSPDIQFWNIPDGGGVKTFKGQINLTKLYSLGVTNKFFPGLTNQGLDTNVGITWAGTIVENHGPFRTLTKIKKYEIYLK